MSWRTGFQCFGSIIAAGLLLLPTASLGQATKSGSACIAACKGNPKCIADCGAGKQAGGSRSNSAASRKSAGESKDSGSASTWQREMFSPKGGGGGMGGGGGY